MAARTNARLVTSESVNDRACSSTTMVSAAAWKVRTSDRGADRADLVLLDLLVGLLSLHPKSS